MLWGEDWTWIIPIIVLTTVIHVVVLGTVVSKSLRVMEHPARTGRFLLHYSIIIGFIAFLSTLLLAVEAWLWAATYVHQCLARLSGGHALLARVITIYGNTRIVLAPRGELVGAREALNGIMLFRLTMACFFGTIQSVQARAQR